MNKGQKLMLEDGVPAFLLMTAEERRAAWEKYPPVAMPVFAGAPKVEDAATVALRARLEAEKKTKATVRIAKLLASKDKKPFVPLVWNQRKGVFEPPPTQESDLAAKITFQAFDASNELLLRGCTSIPEAAATPEQIEEKVKFCFNRARSAVNVSVTGIGGTKIGCWLAGMVRSDEDYRSAPMPKVSVETQTVKEVEVAKKTKTKTKKAASVKAKNNGHAASNPNEIKAVVALLKRAKGATTAEILKATGWKRWSIKATGLKITSKIVEGETRYMAS